MREAVTERDEFAVEMPRTSSRASSGISGVMFQPRRLRTGNPDTPDSHSKANGRGDAAGLGPAWIRTRLLIGVFLLAWVHRWGHAVRANGRV
jgi:hypothetical protein